ncbi:hypothetical protein [Rhizobium sp. Root482]|uniref:hypothetical protein n=1 Tax=Rhizobium sp. Root482 TaxID=1736543 RepID=UPI0006F57115|nr:hypothetical protein [Rhizobium sp. Root482]KQY14429.1 hypothetical protein ASD31_09175 [Rhizobium sp. Root482]
MERVYNHADSRQVASVLNQVVRQFENTGTATLTTGTTTTVNNPKVTTQSAVILQPRNANAAASVYFVSAISNGSFVIGHIAGAAGRTFDYAVFAI